LATVSRARSTITRSEAIASMRVRWPDGQAISAP
jgi:hypothetical protein